MFDLFRSREKTVRYVLGFVLGLVALSMVITLIPGYSGYLGGRNTDPQIVAEIAGEPLTAFEVRQTLTRMLKEQQVPPGTESVYVPIFIHSMVADRAEAYVAQRLGFRPGDKEMAEAIYSLIPQLYQDGKFAGREAYAAFLAQQNMTISEFEDNVAKRVASTKLETLAREGVIVTPQEVEDEFVRATQKASFAYFRLSGDLIRNKVQVSQEEIQQAFERTKSTYKTPEKRGYLIFPVDEDTVAATIQIPEAELKAAYEQQKDRFRTPERVHVRHILLKTTDKSKAEVDKLKAQAEDLLKQIKAGANFADLAKKYSEDTGSAAKGGDLDWITRGQTVPEFEKAAFSLKPGQVSDVITTMYGFHILKIEAHENARLKPFEEVRDELKKELARARTFDKMQSLADQIRTALVRSEAEADQIARAAGINPVRVNPVQQGDPLPEVGVNEQFTEAVRDLPQGGVTPVITIGANKLVVAELTEIVPPRQAQLSEVETQVRNQLLSEKASKLFSDKVKETEAELKGGADFAAVAKKLGVEVKTTKTFTLTDPNIPDLGGPAQFQEVFKKQPGETFGPVGVTGGVVFCKVVERIPADLTQLAAKRTAMVLSIKQRRATDRARVFLDGIVKELIREKKLKINEDAINKIAMSYAR
jgi:peptidyl-prolyl cis-trans isomerase D